MEFSCHTFLNKLITNFSLFYSKFSAENLGFDTVKQTHITNRKTLIPIRMEWVVECQ